MISFFNRLFVGAVAVFSFQVGRSNDADIYQLADKSDCTAMQTRDGVHWTPVSFREGTQLPSQKVLGNLFLEVGKPFSFAATPQGMQLKYLDVFSEEVLVDLELTGPRPSSDSTGRFVTKTVSNTTLIEDYVFTDKYFSVLSFYISWEFSTDANNRLHLESYQKHDDHTYNIKNEYRSQCVFTPVY